MLRGRGRGIALLIIGLGGFIVGPALGLSEMGGPWSFLAGFATGIITGMGAVLTLRGSVASRPPR